MGRCSRRGAGDAPADRSRRRCAGRGDADPIVPYEQEVREIDALKKAGGVAELVTIPGGGHGNFPRDQTLRAWSSIDAFVQANVVNKKPVSTSASVR